MGTECWYAHAFEASPTALAVSAPDGAFLRVNAAFEHLTGFAAHELIGRTAQAVGLLDGTVDGACAGRDEGRAGPLALHRRDGVTHQVTWTTQWMASVDGRVCLAAAEDVTEAQASAETLRRVARAFRAVGAAARDLLRAEQDPDDQAARQRRLLEQLGQAIGAVRVTMCEVRRGAQGRRAEGRCVVWAGDGHAARCPYRSSGWFERMAEALEAGQIVRAPAVEWGPAGTSCTVPVVVDGAWWGGLTVELVAHPWSSPAEVEVLRHAAQTLGAALALQQARGARAASEALRAAEAARWSMALDGAGHGVWDWDLRADTAYLSDGWRRVLDDPTDRMRRARAEWAAMVHPDDLEAVKARFEAHLRGQTPGYRSTHRMRTGRGEYRWILDQGMVWTRDEVGRALRMVGTITDVDQAKAHQAALQAERDLFAAGPVAVVVWNAHAPWRLDFVSENAESVLGHPTQALLADDFVFQQIQLPEDRERTLGEVAGHFAAGRDRWSESYRVIGADGSVRWIDDYTAVERGPDGQVVRLRGYLMDATQRKAREARLRLMGRVFDTTHDGIIICDPEGRIVDVNPAFSQITGSPSEAVVGQSARVLTPGARGDVIFEEMMAAVGARGHWRAEFWNPRADGTRFAVHADVTALRGTDGAVSHLVGVFADITPLKQQEARLEHLAHFDPLTGLPNRLLLVDRLQIALARAQRRETVLALCYLDLDGFKPINDRYGHDVGDEVLVEIAARLSGALRAHDTVARVGGDEFVLVLDDMADEHGLARLLERVLARVSRPLDRLNGVRVSASIGVVLSTEASVEPDLLLRQADQAMYGAKQMGRDRFCIFDVEREAALRARQRLLAAVERGLGANEFELYYQPRVVLSTGAVVGAEALIRWNHPTDGLTPPGAFLPALEGHALGLALDRWVMRHAVGQAAAWFALGHRWEISVNVSGDSLLAPGFVAALRETLAEHPALPPALVELEVLESAALADMDRASAVLRACGELGCRLSLDDFGTGHASLSYLRRLPVHLIKVDRSFVADVLDDEQDAALVSAVIGLAAAYDKAVVAEGVETEAVGRQVLEMGCELAQGFGIARPMRAAALPGWAATWRAFPSWRGVNPSLG